MGFDRSPGEEARRSADAVGLQRVDDEMTKPIRWEAPRRLAKGLTAAE